MRASRQRTMLADGGFKLSGVDARVLATGLNRYPRVPRPQRAEECASHGDDTP